MPHHPGITLASKLLTRSITKAILGDALVQYAKYICTRWLFLTEPWQSGLVVNI